MQIILYLLYVKYFLLYTILIIIECYFNQDGFYDEKWEMKYPHIVLEELKRFNEKLLDTRNEEIIKKSKEVVEQLVSFINMAVRNEKNIYVEYD